MKKLLVLMMAVVVAFGVMTGCQEVKEAESKIEGVVQEGEEAVKSAVETLKGDADSILEKLELKEKASMEVLHEDANTVKYKISMLEETAAEDVTKIEEKVEGMAEEFGTKVEEIKNKGVAEAKLIVEVLGKDGKELYSKVFGK